jgi:hypothetical protein
MFFTCGEKVKFFVFLVRIFTLRDKISCHLIGVYSYTGVFNFPNSMEFKLKLINICKIQVYILYKGLLFSERKH